MAAAPTLVLGSVGIVGVGPGREPVILKGNQAAIIALLAVRSPLVVSRAKLIDVVWGEKPPKTADAALRMDVSRVRRRYHEAGYPDAIVAEGDGYRMTLAEPATDLATFEAHVSSAERDVDESDPVSALASLRAALTLWRGEPFANVAVAGDLMVDAAVALERLADSEELLVEVLVAVGELGEAAVTALRNVERSPYRERRWEQLMVAQARSGRPREALATFQRARCTFAEDLGLDLGPGLVELERWIVSNKAVEWSSRHHRQLLRLRARRARLRPISRQVAIAIASVI